MKKTERKTWIKEIMRGIILVDTHTNLQVSSSCGNSRIVAEPIIIETGNCTINILNYTFHREEHFEPKEEYIVPTYNRKPETVNNPYDQMDTISIDNLQYLEEIRLTTQQYRRNTIIGGTVFIIIIVSLLFLTAIIRKKNDNLVKITSEKPLDDPENAEGKATEGIPEAIRFVNLPATSLPVSRPRTIDNPRGEELWNTLLGSTNTSTKTHADGTSTSTATHSNSGRPGAT